MLPLVLHLLRLAAIQSPGGPGRHASDDATQPSAGVPAAGTAAAALPAQVAAAA
eukprot:SAG22_NODE_13264_length_412_cov_0.961661_1_plen_53_part_10